MILLAFLASLGAATVVLLIVVVVSLAKQTARLARSLQEFQRETRPVLEEIQRGADRAGTRLETLRPVTGDEGSAADADREPAG